MAIGVGLAGCSGGEESATEPSTKEDTPTATEIPAPSLSEFEYPEGASQDGISNTELYSAHESAVTAAGSLTLDRERTDVYENGEFSTAELNRFASGGILREVEESDRTEYIWSPAEEETSYVKMEAGFNSAFRIDNQAPAINEVTGLRELRRIITGAEWGEAVEVVSTGDEIAVSYEATGVADARTLAFDADIDSFEATVAVTESGYVSELDYELTVTRDGRTNETSSTSTITAVGETDAEEPEWYETAAEDGAKFDIGLTDDQTAFKLEMVNGDEISSGSRISLQDRQGRGSATVPTALSVGDRLYIGLSDSNELLVDTEQPPADGRSLGGFTRVDLRNDFLLLVSERQL